LTRLSPDESEHLIELLDRVHGALSERVPTPLDGAAEPSVVSARRSPEANEEAAADEISGKRPAPLAVIGAGR
jgi:hypothetical protein